MPIFWDAPYSYIHASTDIGEVVDWIKDNFWVTKEGNKYLAVLHNRNKMVNAFASTEWVAGSEGAVLSRSVTSCAGMTAHLVLLSQTRVGFLSGGRGKTFHQLTQQEQDAQKEEAYARATVALTRAQQICIIMSPLDMRGLVGAATIMGCLKYGACFSGLDAQDDSVLILRLKDEDLLEAPDDSAFLQSLQLSCARVNGVYPPLALVEAFITEDDDIPRVRRLHLIVVDLTRSRRLSTKVSRLLSRIDVDDCAAQNVGIHFPSHGSKIRNPMSYDMSLGMLWMALTCRATSSGRCGRRISPFGVLMPGKGIGFNWTNVVSLARLELSTSSMPSVIFHNALGGQRQSKPWVFLPAILRRMLTSRSWRTTNSSSPQGGSQWNGGQPHQTAGMTWSWMLESKVDLALRVVGQECLTIPLRMHHLRGLVSGL